MRDGQTIAMVLVGLAAAFPAAAEPGDHIPLGDATFTPRIVVGAEYSTNARHEAVLDETSGATDLKISPELELRLKRDDLVFGAKGVYSLHKYFGAEDISLDRYDDFSVQADLDALKQSIIGLRLNEALGIQNQPVDAETVSQSYTKQFRSQTTGLVVLRPTAAMEFLVGGQYSLDDYQTAASDNGGLGHYNTRHTYGPRAGFAWRFLPRTVVGVDFSYDHAAYASPNLTVVDGSDRAFADSDAVRVSGGMRGQITERLIVTIMGGYGSGTYLEETAASADPSVAIDVSGLDQLLVETSVRYALSPDDGLTVGYTKNFRDSFFTNYVAFDKGHVSADARFGERVGAELEANVAAERYRGQETRDDVMLGARGELSYDIRNWASVSAGVNWGHRISSTEVVNYDEVSANLMATLSY